MSDQIELMTGTTVGIRAKDGVVLAAEKRVSYGFYLMSKSGKKVYPITNRIGIASSGVLADIQTIAKVVRANITNLEIETKTPVSVRAAAKLLSIILFQNKYLPYIAETMVGGVDEEGPRLFILDSWGSLIEDDYAALGNGARTAIGIIETGYSSEITVKEAKELAIKAIKEAIARDPTSGDGIDMLTITSNGYVEDSIKL
ncbi:MAG: archaeal proteasome endopeptidase complex subunit beta [Caldivirga sp.]|jgi:proteasome beta subunit